MWTSYLKCMSSSGLYDLRSREKRRGGVCSRLISCLMGRHLAVIRTEGAALGAHLPPEASSTHPQGPPALCWALLHSWRDSAFWAACFAPVWVSCHSKRMAYSPFVWHSLTSGGSITPPTTLQKMQSPFPRTHRPECRECLFSENPEGDAHLTFWSGKDHNSLLSLKKKKVARPHSLSSHTFQAKLINFHWTLIPFVIAFWDGEVGETSKNQHLWSIQPWEYSYLAFLSFSTIS